MARRPTIKDVALKAGVSFKTVSRVLNREPRVRDEVREKVTAAVAELGYRPNVAARGLIGGRSRLIGFLYDNPINGYVTEAELGALQSCCAADYFVAVEPIDSRNDVERQLTQILSSLRVDGLILTPPLSDNETVMATIERLGVRYVRIAPQSADNGAASIRVDDAQGAYAMTARLLDLGHERVAFIQGPPDHGAAFVRMEGYLRAMHERGLQPGPDLIAQGAFTFESGLQAGRDLLARRARPTAIFASNDQLAFGAMAAARGLGFDIPRDLSVAGFDDTRFAAMSWPQLTTVRQPITDMCAAAADMLIAAAGGDLEQYRSLAMTTELIERASVAAPGEGAPPNRAG